MASVPPALQSGAVLGCAGRDRFSTAARVDYAEAAAVVLAGDGHAARTYELAGYDGYTLAELAATISKVAGKSFVYKDMSQEDFKGALVGMGLPEDVAELIADVDMGASRGGLEDDGRQLSALIGRLITPLPKMVEQVIFAA